MRSNKVDYSTATGVYCTTHDVKLSFFMPYFYISNIINHCFHVDTNKGELGIGYAMIIDCDMMVQIDLTADLKCHTIDGLDT